MLKACVQAFCALYLNNNNNNSKNNNNNNYDNLYGTAMRPYLGFKVYA